MDWVLIINEQAQTGQEQDVIPANLAALFVELNAAIHNELLREDYDRHRPATLSKVKLPGFAKEFATAFNKQ